MRNVSVTLIKNTSKKKEKKKKRRYIKPPRAPQRPLLRAEGGTFGSAEG